jgi:serine/threonine protein kinase/formylglycine-generating enzyme required for sulfatase activity
MKDPLHLIEAAELEFELCRDELRQQAHFTSYLPQFVASKTKDCPELVFPLLAKLAQSDLALAITKDKSRTAAANDYFAAFPELGASPAIINDLLRTEAQLRCGGDNWQLWQFQQRLPESLRALFNAEGIGHRYQLQSEIGAGGMAKVWSATDNELQREVAVKVPLKQDPLSLENFFREAQLTSRFRHPAIVPVYGVSRTKDGKLCYAMQRLELKQLKHSIEQYHGQVNADGPTADPLAPTVASGEAVAPASFAAQQQPRSIADSAEQRRHLQRMIGQLIIACRAVSYAHQQEILHLDLKPENILVGDYGETMVLDWGLAKSQQEALAGAGGATLRYMSPEVARRWLDETAAPPSPHTDVYGLGATLYHILTNRPPFAFGEDEFSQPVAAGSGYKERCIARVANEQPTPVRNVNPRADRVLAAICHKAIAADVNERYASAEALAVELEKWQRDEETAAHPFTFVERVMRGMWKHRRSIAGGSGLVFVLVLLAWAGWLVFKHNEVALLVDKLPTVSADSLITQIEEIHTRPSSARSLLQTRLNNPRNPLPSNSKWRYQLALLRYDPQQAAPLLAELQKLDSADEFAVLLRQLHQESSEQPTQNLREPLKEIAQRLVADKLDHHARLRAGATMAAFDPARDWSEPESVQIASDLVRATPTWLVVFNRWIRNAPTAEAKIAQALQELAANSRRHAEETDQAAAILAEWRINQPAALVQLLQMATSTQWPRIIDVIRSFPLQVVGELETQSQAALTQLQKAPAAKSAAEHLKLDDQAAGVANLLLAHWSIEPTAFDGKWLMPAADPRLRTELVHRLPQARIPPMQVLNWFRAEKNLGARNGLLLALSRFSIQDLPDDQRKQFLAQLASSTDVANPEFVATAEHLHRQWKQPLPKWESPTVDPTHFGWMMTKGHAAAPNHRLITIPLSVANQPTQLGAAADEGYHDDDETPRLVTIPRSFAISATEVTRAQFLEFLAENFPKNKPAVNDLNDSRFKFDENDPSIYVDYPLAVMYCNWLSHKDGLKFFYDEPDGKNDPFERNGYRLPTEEEWELACRAGTKTPRYYGYREAYLGYYATYRFNTLLGPQRVASKLPNTWGLFDMLGNVAELCHTTRAADNRSGKSIQDEGALRSVKDIYVRGCGHANVPDVVRAAYRVTIDSGVEPKDDSDSKQEDIGFRIARTLSPIPPAAAKPSEQVTSN